MLGCDAWRGVSHRLKEVIQPILRLNNKPQQTEDFNVQKLASVKWDLQTSTALMIGRSYQFREFVYLQNKSLFLRIVLQKFCERGLQSLLCSPIRTVTCDCTVSWQLHWKAYKCIQWPLKKALTPMSRCHIMDKISWIQGIGAPLLNEARGMQQLVFGCSCHQPPCICINHLPSGKLTYPGHSYWKWPFAMDLSINNCDFP